MAPAGGRPPLAGDERRHGGPHPPGTATPSAASRSRGRRSAALPAPPAQRRAARHREVEAFAAGPVASAAAGSARRRAARSPIGAFEQQRRTPRGGEQVRAVTSSPPSTWPAARRRRGSSSRPRSPVRASRPRTRLDDREHLRRHQRARRALERARPDQHRRLGASPPASEARREAGQAGMNARRRPTMSPSRAPVTTSARTRSCTSAIISCSSRAVGVQAPRSDGAATTRDRSVHRRHRLSGQQDHDREHRRHPARRSPGRLEHSARCGPAVAGAVRGCDNRGDDRSSGPYFDRDGVTISDVACRHGAGRGEGPEPSPARAIVFVRRGCFVRSADGIEAVLDPTVAYCTNPGEEQRYDHPQAARRRLHGDRARRGVGRPAVGRRAASRRPALHDAGDRPRASAAAGRGPPAPGSRTSSYERAIMLAADVLELA